MKSQREWVCAASIGAVEENISSPAPGMPSMRTAARPRPQDSRTSVVWKVPNGVTRSPLLSTRM